MTYLALPQQPRLPVGFSNDKPTVIKTWAVLFKPRGDKRFVIAGQEVPEVSVGRCGRHGERGQYAYVLFGYFQVLSECKNSLVQSGCLDCLDCMNRIVQLKRRQVGAADDPTRGKPWHVIHDIT